MDISEGRSEHSADMVHGSNTRLQWPRAAAARGTGYETNDWRSAIDGERMEREEVCKLGRFQWVAGLAVCSVHNLPPRLSSPPFLSVSQTLQQRNRSIQMPWLPLNCYRTMNIVDMNSMHL